MKMIDTHIHLFDISRKLAYPPKNSLIYKSFLPQAYEQRAKKQNITAAVVIEASPYVKDNDWVLEQIKDLPFFKAFIGNLDFNSNEFIALFENYSKNPKFIGIRAGNLWGRALELEKALFLENFNFFSQKDKILELANPNLELLKKALWLKNKFTNQTLILNHIPNLQRMKIKDLEHILKELASASKLYIKLSAIAQDYYVNNRFDLALYRDFLDFLYEIFTAEKILFASDYPNSEFLGSFEEICALAKAYLKEKPQAEQELILYKNAEKIYKG